MTPNKRPSPELSHDRFKIAVEVRHHAEPIALAKRLEDRAIAGKGERHFGQEARSDALATSAINLTLARSAATARQFGHEFGRQRVDRFLKARRRRKRPDKRVIGRIEGRRESIG